MKNLYIKITLILCLSMAFVACNDKSDIEFNDYYVCIKDENGLAESTVSTKSNDFVVSYYIQLVAPTLKENVEVKYEVQAGDGLQEGVDYVLASKNKTIKIRPGIIQMPIYIKYLRHQLDPNRDNSLTIKILSTNNDKVNIGYPGPDHLFDEHKVTKLNF